MGISLPQSTVPWRRRCRAVLSRNQIPWLLFKTQTPLTHLVFSKTFQRCWRQQKPLGVCVGGGWDHPWGGRDHPWGGNSRRWLVSPPPPASQGVLLSFPSKPSPPPSGKHTSILPGLGPVQMHLGLVRPIKEPGVPGLMGQRM